jgi:hypothetical protein
LAIIESGGGQTVHAVEQANTVTELFMSELRSINSASDALFVASATEGSPLSNVQSPLIRAHSHSAHKELKLKPKKKS